MLGFPGKGVKGHIFLVKIIKIINKITFSLQYLVLYVRYFIFLPSRISESNKIWSRNFCSKIKNSSGTHFVNKLIKQYYQLQQFSLKKKKKKIQFLETKNFFLWIKWKKMVKKNYLHLSKIIIILAKMSVHFSNQIFRSIFHFFDWLHLIVHWYLFFCQCSFEMWCVAICFVYVMKFARFVSVDNSCSAAFLRLAVEHRDPPKMKPFVAVPVRVPTDSAHT